MELLEVSSLDQLACLAEPRLNGLHRFLCVIFDLNGTSKSLLPELKATVDTDIKASVAV